MRQLFARFLLPAALGFALVSGGATVALAQVKPAVTDIGIDKPTSAIYIGNSFFTSTTACTAMLGSSSMRVCRVTSPRNLGDHQWLGH